MCWYHMGCYFDDVRLPSCMPCSPTSPDTPPPILYRAAVVAERRFDVAQYVEVGPAPEAMELS